jgi:uncharacterized protein (TIGR03118 family)
MYRKSSQKTFAEASMNGLARKSGMRLLMLGLLQGMFIFTLARVASAQNYVVKNLTADVSGAAANTDSNLINPIGLTRGILGPWWTANNGTATSSLINGLGVPAGLVVSLPSAPGVSAPVQPTGTTFSGGSGVNTSPGNPAFFMFVTQQGTILGWPGASGDFLNASILVNRNGQASYTGMTIAEIGDAYYVYAVNGLSGQIEIFNSSMQQVQLGPHAFTDPGLPLSLVPFNIQNIGSDVFVTYQSTQPGADGPQGWVSIFSSQGQFLGRLQSGPWLDAPYGVTAAPQDFGLYAHTILVANHGTGNIAAFDLFSHKFIDDLLDPSGNTISIDGLWALGFADGGIAGFPSGPNTGGNGAATGAFNACYFTAGPDMGQHGLVGQLTPVKSEQNNLHQ